MDMPTSLKSSRDNTTSKPAALTLGNVCNMIRRLLSEHEMCLAMELLKELDKAELSQAKVDISFDKFMATVSTIIDDYCANWARMRRPFLTEQMGLITGPARAQSPDDIAAGSSSGSVFSESQAPSENSETRPTKSTANSISHRRTSVVSQKERHTDRTLERPSTSESISNRSEDRWCDGSANANGQQANGVFDLDDASSGSDGDCQRASGMGSFNFAQYLATSKLKPFKGEASTRIDSCESVISAGRPSYHHPQTFGNSPSPCDIETNEESLNDGPKRIPSSPSSPMRPAGAPSAQRPRKKEPPPPARPESADDVHSDVTLPFLLGKNHLGQDRRCPSNG